MMKKKVLIIDDSPFILKTLVDDLGNEFDIQSAKSGEEAIDLLKGLKHSGQKAIAPFDMIITDLNMPGLSGYDVAQFVRSMNRESRFTPVIMLTEMEITKEEARLHGCAVYIPKKDLSKVKSMARILLTR